MSLLKLPFWKRWLIHSFTISLLINLSIVFNYWFNSGAPKLYLKSADGTYSVEMSLGYKLVLINYHEGTVLLILAVLFFIELNTQYLFKKKMPIFLGGSIITGVCGLLVLMVYSWQQHGRYVGSYLEPFLLMAGYSFVYPLILEFIDKRVLRSERRYEQSRAEINALKAQIHPHFLFNTINSIYGTAIMENASLTANSIQTLANLMRYVFTETAVDFVTVTNELNFLKEYIDLQKMRLPQTTSQLVITTFENDGKAVMIAPLLLIPFIENSFKYGISIDHESFINLELTIVEGNLTMILKNSVVKRSAGSGTGLENVKRRLALLYPDRYTLQIQQTAHEFVVILNIQLGIQ